MIADPPSRFSCPSAENGHSHIFVETATGSPVFVCRLYRYEIPLTVVPHEFTEAEVQANLFVKNKGGVFNGTLVPGRGRQMSWLRAGVIRSG